MISFGLIIQIVINSDVFLRKKAFFSIFFPLFMTIKKFKAIDSHPSIAYIEKIADIIISPFFFVFYFDNR